MSSVYSLLAAGGPGTFVATKVTKKAVTRNASLRSWPLPCKSARTTGCNYLPRFAPSIPVFCKTCYALAAAQATHILPAFVRSCSADGGKNNKLCYCEEERRSNLVAIPFLFNMRGDYHAALNDMVLICY